MQTLTLPYEYLVGSICAEHIDSGSFSQETVTLFLGVLSTSLMHLHSRQAACIGAVLKCRCVQLQSCSANK